MTKHFTSTVYITAKIDGVVKVLLHFHKKLKFWIGVGGHIEKNENPVEAAIREVKEETGLDVTIRSHTPLFEKSYAKEIPMPQMILEASVPAHKDTEAHKHIDFAYFAETRVPQDVVMEERFKWFTKDQVETSDILEEIKILGTKAIHHHEQQHTR
jgi:8-oxo-dGTP pyrophosphatase MutT (NUDIX family)